MPQQNRSDKIMNNKSTSKYALVVVDREDWHRDESLMRELLSIFPNDKYEIIRENPAAATISSLRKIEHILFQRTKSANSITSKLGEILYGILHPSHFHNLYYRKKTVNSIEFRCNNLRKKLSNLPKSKEIVLLSRSSGGRVSSLIADELNISHVICLGYPFKHPQKLDEPERYLHLAEIKTPTLIIQGIHDPYGGSDIEGKYILSDKIEVYLADDDHDFTKNSEELKKILSKIIDWLQHQN